MATHTTSEVEQQKVFAVLMSEHKQMKRALEALDGMPERVRNIEDDIREIKDGLRVAVMWVFGLIGSLVVAGIGGLVAWIVAR